MEIDKTIFNEFVRNGYANRKGSKVWDISDRRFLYLTPEMAKGFLNLRKFKVYKKQVINREIKLIRKYLSEFAKDIGNKSFNLVDVFCGDGKKAGEFIKAIKSKSDIKYCPLNVNNYLVDLAMKNVKKKKFSCVKDFERYTCFCDSHSFGEFISKIRSKEYSQNVVLLLGSVLASYEINDYLFGLSKNMKKGDYLIIGNGVRTGQRLVSLENYKHGVWDEWFFNLMKGLSFEKGDLDYDARFGNSRIEMFYKVKKDKRISHEGKEIVFNSGDEILTAVLYKYYSNELKKFCEMYFSDVKVIEDKEGEYALAVCRK